MFGILFNASKSEKYAKNKNGYLLVEEHQMVCKHVTSHAIKDRHTKTTVIYCFILLGLAKAEMFENTKY